MIVQPYLNFAGRCEEALNFYRAVLGAEVTMMLRFKDAPAMVPPREGPPAEKIMHSELRIGETTIFATDGENSGHATFSGTSLTLGVSTDAEAVRLFANLSEGGKVTMPMTKTFFASSFGMLTDRFGVTWMVMAPAEGAPS